MIKFEKSKAYIAKNYIDMLQYVEGMITRKSQFELIKIDDVYVLVHPAPIYNLTLGPLVRVSEDSNNTGCDIQIVLYPDFFKLPNANSKIFLLAYCVGRFKTSNLKLPEYGIEQRRQKYIKVGKTVEEDLAADIYAAKVIRNKVKITMLTIAQYIEDHMQWDEGALDMRLRAYQQPFN